MSTIVHDYSFSNIGRMFARQNVPSIYGAHKGAAAVQAEEAGGVTDSVSLSPFAPKPLDAVLLRDALTAGKNLSSGGKLPEEEMERLREDRVFAAVSALALMGDDGETGTVPREWPGGIPAPTQGEMEEARRRLSQRVQNAEAAENVEQLQQDRLTLLEKLGKRSFAPLTPETAMESVAMGAKN